MASERIQLICLTAIARTLIMPRKLEGITVMKILTNRRVEQSATDSGRGFGFSFFSFSTAATAEDAGV